MKLKFTNTLTGKLEFFTPINNKNIKLYVCGPTVYDKPHIGNARALVIYDVLYRILMEVYGNNSVTFVRNITDIDDKIIQRAKDLGISINELTSKVTKGFHEDSKYLHCLSPTFEPKATETIDTMIEIIEKLINNHHAYVSNNHVYYSTKSFADYGKLAGKEIDNLIQGSRIEIDNNKKHPADFVLWKPSTGEDLGAAYQSPWGAGRPGWHIECSAMSYKFLGTDFDIHGGGADLMFPHHTNEIAQSCCAFPGSKFANYWVHNGFLTVNGEKMSKSLGNFITIYDMREKKVKGEVIRLLLLNSHYRSPIDYNEKALYDATETMNYFYRALEDFDLENFMPIEFSNLPTEFTSAICDDLNIHSAISIMTQITKEINKSTGSEAEEKAKILASCGKILGFFAENTSNWFNMNEIDSGIEVLIEERKIAKLSKNWKEADRIRDLLVEKGIILEDKPNGQVTWRKNN